MWESHTGVNPNKDPTQREWYRTALLEGAPTEVQKAMKENPDLPGSDSTVWERHLIHHLTRVYDEKTKTDDHLKDLQTQLLKMQIAEAHQKGQTQRKTRKLLK